MTEKPLIALVEDDDILGASLQQRLALEGFRVIWYQTGEAAIEGLRRTSPHLLLSDMRLPDMTGEEVMRQSLGHAGSLPIVFMTAYGSFDDAVRLVAEGARDYLIKPFDLDELVERLKTITARAEPEQGFASFGLSPAMRQVRAVLQKAALVDMPVLVTGETGVGKEVAARFLAEAMGLRQDRLLPVNCASLTPELADSELFGHAKGAFTGAHTAHEGAARRAGKGILFLDEVGELNPATQAKLLRLVQEREFTPVGGRAMERFEGRLVFATNRKLEDEVSAGRFREDLFYRINVITVDLPPLRARVDEINPLLDHFLKECSARLKRPSMSVADDARIMARGHHWPGNVRELRNRVERAVALSDSLELGVADLFPDLKAPRPATAAGSLRLADVRDAAESAHIIKVLEETGGQTTLAANILGISRTTLWEKMKRYGLDGE